MANANHSLARLGFLTSSYISGRFHSQRQPTLMMSPIFLDSFRPLSLSKPITLSLILYSSKAHHVGPLIHALFPPKCFPKSSIWTRHDEPSGKRNEFWVLLVQIELSFNHLNPSIMHPSQDFPTPDNPRKIHAARNLKRPSSHTLLSSR